MEITILHSYLVISKLFFSGVFFFFYILTSKRKSILCVQKFWELYTNHQFVKYKVWGDLMKHFRDHGASTMYTILFIGIFLTVCMIHQLIFILVL